VPHVFEWFYVDGAVAPMTGDQFCLARPALNAEMCRLFIDAFAEAFPSICNLLLLRSQRGTYGRATYPPRDRALGVLAALLSNTQPLKRVWHALKEALAWLPFAHPDGQQD